MKRFLLFADAGYCPGGGWNDFVDSFDDLASAKEAADKPNPGWDWRHIVDLQTGTIVYESQITPSGKRENEGGTGVGPEANHSRANHHYVLDERGQPRREHNSTRWGEWMRVHQEPLAETWTSPEVRVATFPRDEAHGRDTPPDEQDTTQALEATAERMD